MTEGPARILVIDDDPGVLGLMAEILRMRGYEPRVVLNSAEVPGILKQDAFDLIITDVVMPHMHGLRVLDLAKQCAPATPVLMVTGHAHREIVKESFEHGAYAFLEKPFRITEFLAMVEQALKSGHA